MALEEIILSEKVLFDENDKLRDGGKKFLEHISKYAQKVVILGFKPSYTPELSFYIKAHLKDANLVLNMDKEITYHLLSDEELNFDKIVYVAVSDAEIIEAQECKIPFITFNYKTQIQSAPNFKTLKEITGYLSHCH